MKKYYKILLELAILAGLITIFTQLSAFAAYLPIGEETSDIYREGSVPVPAEGETGLEIARQLALNGLAYVKILIGVIGILYLSITGVNLVTASGDEEKLTKAKRAVTYIVVAFVIVSMSQDLAKIFDMEGGTIISSPEEILKRVHIFDKQVEIFMTFVKYMIGAYAVLYLVRSGIKLVTAGGDEEQTTKHKKGLLYSAGGLVLIYVGDIFINRVFYKVDKDVYTGISGVQPTADPVEGVKQIIGITNFIVSFVGPIAILMLIVGAVMYATAGGDEERMEKAKKLVIATVIGIIIIYGAFAIVSTVISGQLSEAGALIE